MTKDERNDAIVKLYRDDYTQEAIGEMFGLHKGDVGRIAGAKERTRKVKEKVGISNSAELTSGFGEM